MDIMKRMNWLLLTLAVGLGGLACSDGEKDDPPEEKDDAGATGPVTYMCEATTCTTPEIDTSSLPAFLQAVVTPEQLAMLVPVQGCCTDDTENPCGVENDGVCVQQNQPGVADETCPAAQIEVMTFPIELAGCCKPGDMCGFDLGLAGIGCVERTEAAMSSIMGMSIPDAENVKSLACGTVLDAGLGDAGLGDAGPGDEDAGM